jgi:peptidyl-prolyl cis-trans isomerase SurA
MNWKQIAATAATVLALSSAQPSLAQNAEGVAATVNDHVISTYDVRQRAQLLLISAGMDPTPELQQRARSQALRDLVDERLQVEEAARYEITVDAEVIQRRLADIARQNQSTVEDLTANLARAGVSISTLRDQIAADIAWQRLIGGMYGSRVRVSEVEISEMQARMAANASRPQIQLSEIFLPAETEAEFAEMEQGATRLIEQMQRGAPFPLVARQFSQAPSAAAGGDVGWVASTDLVPELQAIAERLQAGQVSLPIRTNNGVYIIAVRARRAGAAEGSTTIASLRQITAPLSRQSTMERLQRRVDGCGDLDRDIASIQGANVIDLGQTVESDLAATIRDRISGVETGRASPVVIDGEQVNMIVICSRETGGGGLPSRDEIAERLREQELTLLAERYLRNLRREATIITRQ